jgi:hypothetical protein
VSEWELTIFFLQLAVLTLSTRAFVSGFLAPVFLASIGRSVVLATVGLQKEIIAERLFVALVVMAITTSALSAPAVQWFLAGNASEPEADELLTNEKT